MGKKILPHYLGCPNLNPMRLFSPASHHLPLLFKTTSTEIQKNYISHKVLHAEGLWRPWSAAAQARAPQWRKMAAPTFTARLYSLLFRRTSTFALTIAVGALFFERAFDQGADAIYEHINEGVRDWAIPDLGPT